MMTGIVKFFDPEKKYGFISPRDGSPDVFFHASAISDLSSLKAGQAVEFDLSPELKPHCRRASSVKGGAA